MGSTGTSTFAGGETTPAAGGVAATDLGKAPSLTLSSKIARTEADFVRKRLTISAQGTSTTSDQGVSTTSDWEASTPSDRGASTTSDRGASTTSNQGA